MIPLFDDIMRSDYTTVDATRADVPAEVIIDDNRKCSEAALLTYHHHLPCFILSTLSTEGQLKVFLLFLFAMAAQIVFLVKIY